MVHESSPETGPKIRKQDSPGAANLIQQPIRSEDLLRGGREVQILHAGELYRLTLTRAGKLILHK